MVICVVIGLSANLNSQTATDLKPLSERITDIKNKLQLKLLLSKEQVSSVDTLLKESTFKSFSKESKEEILKSINSKVESFLTKKQKAKFNIIKVNWLDSLLEGSK
jgi:predicted GIY-YIG superfamily endonuclease